MMTAPPQPPVSAAPSGVFDRRRHALRRGRAAARFADHAFLKAAAAQDIAERLSAINRHFAAALDLGAHDGTLSAELLSNPACRDRIGHMFRADLSPAFAAGLDLACDEERLPFAEASLDLVVSALSLHWVNDLPGALIQVRRALRPDGLFIAALLGGRTLTELRSCLIAAEAALTGGASMRVSPFMDVLDGARLLQRCGFALPVADTHVLTVRYGDPMRLLRDLRGMGETACPTDRPPALRRDVLLHALDLYVQRHSDPDGRVRASFEFVTLSGWAPAASQQKPLKPGSASARLADALEHVRQKRDS